MKKNEIKSILNDINKYSELIKESYIFDEDDELLDSNDDIDNYEDYDNDDIVKDDSESVNDKINQIRSIALQGIQEYAKEVDSDEYNIFKNIWMACDKFYASKNKDNEEIK